MSLAYEMLLLIKKVGERREYALSIGKLLKQTLRKSLKKNQTCNKLQKAVLKPAKHKIFFKS